MDIKDIASRILKASNLYSNGSMMVALSKDRDAKEEQEGRNRMNKGEADMIEVLTDFQNSILEKAKQ